MITPDAHVGNTAYRCIGLLGELSLGAVFIQTCHGKEPLIRHLRCIIHGDQAVGVAGVAHYQNAYVTCGVVVDGLTLAGENLAINTQ